MLAWGENLSLLEKREGQISALKAERDELSNRVALLDPDHVDPDLAGELVRKNLNVVHPDEVVITLRVTESVISCLFRHLTRSSSFWRQCIRGVA